MKNKHVKNLHTREGRTVAEISDTRPVFYIALLLTNPLRHTSAYNDIQTILITFVS